MNSLYENFGDHFKNTSDEFYYIRLFFYVNSLILLTMSWRKHKRQELKPFIIYHLRKFNKLRKKAKKKKKRKRVIVM